MDVGDRKSDRYDVPRGLGRALPVGDVNGRLGRAIQVMQLHLGEPTEEALGEFERQSLSAAHDLAEADSAMETVRGEEQAEHRRNEMHRCHAIGDDRVHQILAIAMTSGLCDYQTSSRDERPEELPDRNIKAIWCLLQNAIVLRQEERVLHPQETVDQATVDVHHALRFPGRTGGVDHVRGAVGMSTKRWILVIETICRPPRLFI